MNKFEVLDEKIYFDKRTTIFLLEDFDDFELPSPYISLMTDGNSNPSLNIRKFVAKSFIKYVVNQIDIMVC